MTENEAIEELKCYTSQSGTSHPEEIEIAIKALEEVRQYRKHGVTVESALNNMCDLAAAENLIEEYRGIGTPEECRAAMEKQTAKKVENSGEHIPFEWYCPTCGNTLCDGGWKDTEIAFCEECGQKINWGNDENKSKKLGQIISYGKASRTVRGDGANGN